jgi:hypothetical protein
MNKSLQNKEKSFASLVSVTGGIGAVFERIFITTMEPTEIHKITDHRDLAVSYLFTSEY